jgi:putative SbcD/Mre11-related phosphoesterase
MIVHDDWLLTAQRAAVHLPTATAVIADLHLGYDQVRRRGGEAVPAFEMTDTLAALQKLVARQRVRRLVVAGDCFEDGRCSKEVTTLSKMLTRLNVEFVGIVPGNHDRRFAGSSAEIALFPKGLRLGRWRVVHGDDTLPRGRVVQGHIHPCVRWQGVAAPCFLVSERRLVLPAFSADAAGVNVLRQREWRDYRCCVIVGERVLDFGDVRGFKKQVSRDPKATSSHARLRVAAKRESMHDYQ